MIIITIKKENHLIKEITIKGHANFAPSGLDIVCASVSSIAITSINAMLRFDKKGLEYIEKDGYLQLKISKRNHIRDLLMENMMALLKELKQQYPKNIIIKEG